MKTKSNATLAHASTCIFALAIVVGLSHADPITLTNPGFETPVNADPLSTGRFAFGESRDFGPNGATDAVEAGDENHIAGWTTVTTENGAIDGAELSVGFANITPAAGAQAISLMSGASTRQFTNLSWSSLNVGDTITMTVAIGDRTNTGVPNWADQSFFGIIDSTVGSSIASLLSTTVANSGELATPFTSGGINGGTMQDRSFTYTVVAGDSSRPGYVGVLLAAYGTVLTAGDQTGLTPNNNTQAFFDNVRLDYISAPEPPKITTFTAIGGGVWELTLEGNASTDYEFRSSATLEFNPGTLVGGLTQGNPGMDPGIVDAGGNFVTTDANGAAKVRLTLTGAPMDFVRGGSLP